MDQNAWYTSDLCYFLVIPAEVRKRNTLEGIVCERSFFPPACFCVVKQPQTAFSGYGSYCFTPFPKHFLWDEPIHFDCWPERDRIVWVRGSGRRISFLVPLPLEHNVRAPRSIKIAHRANESLLAGYDRTEWSNWFSIQLASTRVHLVMGGALFT